MAVELRGILWGPLGLELLVIMTGIVVAFGVKSPLPPSARPPAEAAS